MAFFGRPQHPTMASQAFAAEPASSPAAVLLTCTQAARNRWAGCTASLIVHVVVLGVAGLIGVSAPAELEMPMLDSVWSDVDPLPDLSPMAEIVRDNELLTNAPGGRTIEHSVALLDDTPPRATAVERPLLTAISPFTVQTEAWSVADLLSPAGEAQRSQGDGAGTLDGAGDGAGFFGLTPEVGKKIVYVVDNSRSMNHPHESEAKTRFRRLKVELINSIWNMPPEQQFYVIFFNNELYAMPATTLQPATQAAKRKYLSWVATMDANGAPTDPRKAMDLALQFQPDVIYFLTDGEFDKIVNRKLLRIKQQRTTIHTFAFGERIGEAVLKEVARNNQGKYTFIP